MQITVNGEDMLVSEEDRTLVDDEGYIAYEGILKLAGHAPDRVLSVMYATRRKGDEQRRGSLSHGESTYIEDRMQFDVVDTSRA